MNSKRVFFIMIGLVCLLVIAAAGSVVLGNQALAKKTSRLAELKLENRVLEEQALSVTQAQKDIDKYAELERIAKQIVPQDKDQAKAVREIVKLAQESGISLASISFPSSNLGQAAAPAAKPAEGETAAPAAPAAPSISQVKAVDGIAGLYQLDITTQSNPDTTTYPELITFLHKLESNRRTATISSISITPNSGNRNQLTFTMTLSIYIKP
jgi:Tfp pilus assembly protein PilO